MGSNIPTNHIDHKKERPADPAAAVWHPGIKKPEKPAYPTASSSASSVLAEKPKSTPSPLEYLAGDYVWRDNNVWTGDSGSNWTVYHSKTHRITFEPNRAAYVSPELGTKIMGEYAAISKELKTLKDSKKTVDKAAIRSRILGLITEAQQEGYRKIGGTMVALYEEGNKIALIFDQDVGNFNTTTKSLIEKMMLSAKTESESAGKSDVLELAVDEELARKDAMHK